jgi:hypothetical protein
MKIIRLADLLTFGLAALVATALALSASLTPQDEPWSPLRWVGLWGTAGLFWVAIAAVIIARWRYLRRGWRSLASGGALVIDNGFRFDFVSTVLPTLDKWVIAFGADKVETLVMSEALRSTLIILKEPGFKIHGKPGRYVGYFMPTKSVIMAGSEAALAHELGHLFLHATGRDASEASLKGWADEHGLPY